MKVVLRFLVILCLSISLSSANEDLLDEFNEEMQVEVSSDPFSGYNRVMTSFNDGVYEYFLSPVAKGYKEMTHEQVRDSVSNFFDNLLFPLRFVNNILQGKFSYAGEELGRFLINSTLGMAGLFDPASEQFGLKAHKEDFGQTLGYWGVGSGPHIVLPFFGPSNLRDFVGGIPDSMINPIDYYDQREYNLLNNNLESIGVKTFSRVNDTAIEDQYGIIKQDAIDLYPYLKNSYEQYRIQQIKE
jgi:phospholipid-binding lipoprotein MlaA